MTYIPESWFIDASKPWRGVHRRISIESVLPMEATSHVLAIIASTPSEGMSRRAFFPRLTVACECCGKVFVRTCAEIRKSAKNGTRIMCSQRCGQIATNERAGKLGAHCKHCGAHVSKEQGWYCSQDCKGAARAKRMQATKEALGTKPCEVCGVQFQLKNRTTNQRFCSRGCQHVAHSEEMRGSVNHGWRGGADKKRRSEGVPAAWRKARSIVLAADGACVICAATAGLHVHHINHDSSDNRLGNLITLCSVCHYKHHAAERSVPQQPSPFPQLSALAEARTSLISKSLTPTAFSQMERLSIIV